MVLFRGSTRGGSAERETHRGSGGVPGGGPHVVLSMRVEDGIVQQARYKTYGCPVAIACSEAVCVWSEGRALEELPGVTAAVITDWLGGVPEGKEHIPALAAEALGGLTR